MKLNLGCGSQVPDGWINVDFGLGARFTKIPFFRTLNRKIKLFNMDWDDRIFLHDLTTPFPWPDGSADATYSSHTLEHFSRDDGRAFLTECHRVLRKDGIIRIVIPDLRYHVDEYLAGRIRADDFVEDLGVLYEKRTGLLKKALSPFVQFPHKCMYDAPRLLEILNEIGFDAASRGAFDSDIDDISQIESKGRTDNALIVEGRKR